MLNVLASIIVAETEDGEMRVGLDIQPDDDSLKKVQEVITKLAEDMKHVTSEDVLNSHNANLEKEISNKINSLDIDKYIHESEEFYKEELIAQEILNGGKL